MPKSPKNWPFPNRLYLGSVGTHLCDTPVCDYCSPWSRLLNRHGRVVCPCKSCFNPTKHT
ncbi:Error-prone DNA polymerase [Gossypium arboreum]|uniref:Error-prone DNA polymerase n=1 Tax=Gossypium arboreum TaxID=29729 RepID=A0A0B0MGG6_GOSAR|nr:Error-prone DNA polymerase [Gossypium arboreum]